MLNPRKVLWFTTLLLAALSIFVLWGGAHATARSLTQEELDEFGVTLLGGTRSSLDRCIRRCERNNPPLPSPQPTHSPKPLPCEPIGTKTFVIGQDRTFCFTAGPGSTFVTIEATTPANVGCAYFQLELTEPNGKKPFVDGATYPMMISSTPRVVDGRYYFWVLPLWISDAPGCDTYRMTVR